MSRILCRCRFVPDGGSRVFTRSGRLRQWAGHPGATADRGGQGHRTSRPACGGRHERRTRDVPFERGAGEGDCDDSSPRSASSAASSTAPTCWQRVTPASTRRTASRWTWRHTRTTSLTIPSFCSRRRSWSARSRSRTRSAHRERRDRSKLSVSATRRCRSSISAVGHQDGQDVSGIASGIGAINDFNHQLQLAFMRKYNVDANKVSFVPIGPTPQIVQALVAGKIDAGTGLFERSAAPHQSGHSRDRRCEPRAAKHATIRARDPPGIHRQGQR